MPDPLTTSALIDFQFQDPFSVGSKNLSAPVSGFFSGKAFILESYYWDIPQVPGVNCLDLVNANLGLAQIVNGDELDGTSTIPFVFKNSSWETKLDLSIKSKTGLNAPNTRNFYLKNWASPVQLNLNTLNLDSSLAGTSVELQIVLNIRVSEEGVDN